PATDRALSATEERPQEEPQVGGALGQAAGQVRVPGGPERHVHPHVVSHHRQPPLLVGSHPVEHLELERLSPLAGEVQGDRDEGRVVGGDGRAHIRRLHEHREQPHECGDDLPVGLQGDGRRFDVGAFDQPDVTAEGKQALEVVGRSMQCRLEGDAQVPVLGLGLLVDANGGFRVRRAFHVDGDGGAGVGRRSRQAVDGRFCQVRFYGQPQLGELDGDVGGDSLGGDRLQCRHVLVGGPLRPRPIVDFLTQQVEGHEEALGVEPAGGFDACLHGVAGDEPLGERTPCPCLGYQLLYRGGGRGGDHGPGECAHSASSPSSRARSAAACTASSTRARKPRSSRTCMAAAVVPPGDVTWPRSSEGPSPVSVRRWPAPRTVWWTKTSATSRGIPSRIAASVSASARRKTYAGPVPDTAVTASRLASSMRLTTPTAPSAALAASIASSSAWVPAAIPVTPSPTSAGVLGMARITATPGRRSSNTRIGTPAATDTTIWGGRIAFSTWSRRAVTSRGLVATTTTSRSPTASTGSNTTGWPVAASTAAARSGRRAATETSSVVHPAERRPRRRASPMAPAPRMATVGR